MLNILAVYKMTLIAILANFTNTKELMSFAINYCNDTFGVISLYMSVNLGISFKVIFQSTLYLFTYSLLFSVVSWNGIFSKIILKAEKKRHPWPRSPSITYFRSQDFTKDFILLCWLASFTFLSINFAGVV